ncbi:thermonuclease family protein [Candidatus Shapirobacteria bacterium]|nr:thermonuclease family protein [Candidatus Shapirobacteria bacterium]
MKINKLALATLILLVPSLTANIKYSLNPQVGDKVIKIIDGDTFKLENNQTIRLASIDAPEVGFCYSSEATMALSDLILNKRVTLLEPYASVDGRIIALVISNGQIINEVMVRNGYATDTYDNFSAKKALQSANDYARQKSLGIYSEQCSQVVPSDLGCVIKGNHHQADNSKIYSYPGCTNYNRTIVGLFEGDQWFCSESEAKKAGYVRSGDCQSDFGKF